MKIDMTQPLINFDGNPIQNGDAGDFLLGAACCNALMGDYVQERDQLSSADKVKRYALSIRIFNEAEVDLEAEDVVLIKKLMGYGYVTAVVGAAFQLLDPVVLFFGAYAGFDLVDA